MQMILKAFIISGIAAMASTFVYQPMITITDAPKRDSVISQPNFEAIGKQIRIVRESKRISREGLAEALKIEETYLKAIEEGTAVPVKTIIFRIEEILETTFDGR
jgi:ribosome-binding protein aMBF1 (putative translation factor)